MPKLFHAGHSSSSTVALHRKVLVLIQDLMSSSNMLGELPVHVLCLEGEENGGNRCGPRGLISKCISKDHRKECAAARSEASVWRGTHRAAAESRPSAAPPWPPPAAHPRRPADRGVAWGLDLTEARAWLPDVRGCRLWFEHQTVRVRVSFVVHGARVTTSAPVTDRDDVRRPAAVCLKWAWRQHMEHGHGPCPFPEFA